MRSGMRKKPHNRVKKTRITVCIGITALFFVLFAFRLADWQLIHGEEYKRLAARSTAYTQKTDAVRGEILDCNGEGLVVNTTHYRVVLDKLYIDESKLDETIVFLIDLMDKAGEKWENTLPIEQKADGTLVFKSGNNESIEYILSSEFLNLHENANAEQCFDELVKRYDISQSYTDSQLINLVSVHYNMELTDYSNSNPYVFADDIKQSTAGAVSESTQGMSGVEVQTYLVRGAGDADIAPHILGALGSVTEEEYDALSAEGKNYSLDDKIGKFGIELAFEDELRGKGGTKIIHRNSDGAVVDTVEAEDASPGNTVYLTIDSKLQKTAVKSLAENVTAAQAQGKSESYAYGEKGHGEDCDSGAVVMLKVSDFSVLAAASYPTYDLNKYSEYGSYYIKLSQDESSPMYNRACVGSFACGSVFKPCVAGAALEEKIIDSQSEIYCKEKYDYYPTNIVRCMHYHGNLNVTGALEESCNYFFADTGRRLGIETMYLYAQRFGLGEYTGIEIEESRGTLAGRDSTSWQPGNTVQAAIGQSDNAFTTLQLAAYTATIANDGTRMKTHIVKKITNYEQTKTLKSFSGTALGDCGVSQKNLDIVQNAMLGVTQSENGTAYGLFGDYRVKVAAKTGTAENSGSDHATFICYAPYDKPEVAVSVVIENGVKGRYAMQVAKDLLDAYFAKG